MDEGSVSMSIRDIIITRDTKVRVSEIIDKQEIKRIELLTSIRKRKEGYKKQEYLYFASDKKGKRNWTINRGTLGTIESVSGVITIPSFQGIPSYPNYMKTKIFDGTHLLVDSEELPYYIEY
jgi:hypothetical protein